MPRLAIRRVASLAVALFASIPGPGAAQVAENPRVAEAVAAVQTWLEAERAYEQIPGVSAAIVHDQELVWSGAYGMAHPDRQVAATPTTVYSICSISKLFTSISVRPGSGEGPPMTEALTYARSSKLGELLSLQQPGSEGEHDAVLFIVINVGGEAVGVAGRGRPGPGGFGGKGVVVAGRLGCAPAYASAVSNQLIPASTDTCFKGLLAEARGHASSPPTTFRYS